jgi:DNA-binding transcriptional LysR family regulator
MIALARSMAEMIADFERRVAGRDVRPTGELRVTTVDAMATYFARAVFAKFRAQNPGVVLEVILSARNLNLSRRDAEVAIRATNEPQEALVGRKICTLRWSVYATPAIKAAYGPRVVAEAPWIGFGENYGPARGRRWIEAHIAKGRQAYKVNSLLSMTELAAQGVGAAILPCFVGDQRPELWRVGGAEPDLDVGLWILTHADLRHSARVRAFMDFAGTELTKIRGLIEGEGLETPIAAAS